MRLAWLLLVAVALAGAGCGGEKRAEKAGGDEPPTALLLEAAKKLASIETYRAKMELKSAGSEVFAMTGETLATSDSSRSRTTGRLSIDGERPTPIELRQFGRAQYMRGKAFGPLLPAGKKWLRMDDESPASTPPVGDFLEFLGRSKGFENLGSSSMRGRRTTHFGGPLNLKEFAEFAGPETAAMFRGVADANAVKARLDIWIDDDARPARMTMEFLPNEQQKDVLNVDLDFIAFDEPADFQRPADAEVARSADLQSG